MILAFPQYLYSQEIDTEESSVSIDTTAKETKVHMVNGVPLSKSPTGAFLRSLVVPGWGQAYTHNWFKAVAFLGVDASMVYGIYVQDQRYRDNKELARKAKEDDVPTYESIADFYRDDRNRMIWWTAGVVLLASFDAYVEAHLYDFEIDPTLGVSPSGDGPSIGIQIKF